LNFKIIDSHVHFDVKGYDITNIRKDYLDEYGAEKFKKLQEKNRYIHERWKKAWNFPDPEPIGEDVKVTAEKWLKEMDDNNIEKMIFVTGGCNEVLSDVIKLHPDRFVGYAHHNPFEKDSSQKLEDAIANKGLKGYKILAPGLHGKIDDEVLNPVWDVAEKYKLPVLIHFGILGAAGGIADDYNISPMRIHNIARAYPDISFIIPHFGCGQPGDLLQLAWVCSNVYVDTSGSNQWTRWMPYPLTVRDLFKKYYETIGPERIIFGTDSSWFPRGFVKRYFEDQMRDCIELGMSQEDIENIFRNNIVRLLGLEN
jgi:uncharacterized protein